MTDREKLIELITIGGFFSRSADAEKCVDYLIANGVTVSPIPVGSTVYALYNRSPNTYRRNKRHARNFQIVTNRNLDVAIYDGGNIEIRAKKANKQDVHLLGRLVFLTKEEAETHLPQPAEGE